MIKKYQFHNNWIHLAQWRVLVNTGMNHWVLQNEKYLPTEQYSTPNRPRPLRSTLFQIHYLPKELVDTETEILTVSLRHFL